MSSGWPRAIAVSMLFGWLYATVYASVSRDLGSLAPVSLPLWSVVVGFGLIGVFIALVVVDLRQTFVTVLAASVLGAFIYAVLLASPGVFVTSYWVQMANHAVIQSSLLLLLAGLLGVAGAMVGSVINSTVRDIEL